MHDFQLTRIIYASLFCNKTSFSGKAQHVQKTVYFDKFHTKKVKKEPNCVFILLSVDTDYITAHILLKSKQLPITTTRSFCLSIWHHIDMQYTEHFMSIHLCLSGGLFGDEESATTQNAFKYAIYRINHEPDLLGGTSFEYDIRPVHNGDQFRASKDSTYF